MTLNRLNFRFDNPVLSGPPASFNTFNTRTNDRGAQNNRFSSYWQRALSALLLLVNALANGVMDSAVLDSSQAVTGDLANEVIKCLGTITLTLPLPAQVSGYRFFFKNLNTALGSIVTIAGTIDGNPAGWKLTNPYQYVSLYSDGSQWLIIGNN